MLKAYFFYFEAFSFYLRQMNMIMTMFYYVGCCLYHCSSEMTCPETKVTLYYV